MATSTPQMDYTVVILAGGSGSRMTPISEGMPKALLPIGNRPMITYILESFQRAEFRDAIVVCRQSHMNEMSKFFDNVYPQEYGNLRIEQCYVEDDIGTADALRIIKDKIKRDFIVASCDLVSDVAIHRAIDLHVTNDATLTAVTFRTPKMEDNKKQKLDTGIQHFLGTDTTGSKLLLYCAAVDVEEMLQVRMSLLKRFPHVRLHTDVSDGHLYILKRWVIDLIAARESISSLQGDLVPLLVKAQFRNVRTITEGPYALASFIKDSNPLGPATALSTVVSEAHAQQRSPVTCCVYQLPAGPTLRVNTTALYWEVNRAQLKAAAAHNRPHLGVELAARAQIGGDSIVGVGTKVGEASVIKKSVIGSHCIIGANCKITNSIIMDHTSIEDGCIIDGSIISHTCKILNGANIKESEIACMRTITAGAKMNKEKLGHDSMDLD